MASRQSVTPQRLATQGEPDKPGKVERTVQSSISLQPALWKRIDILGDLTRWGRSGALAEAAELLTSLPVSTSQRLATLKRTTAGEALRDRIRKAIQEAVDATEAELPDDPWAEFDAALVAVGSDLEQSPIADLSETELIDAASAAKRVVRRTQHRKQANKPARKGVRKRALER